MDGWIRILCYFLSSTVELFYSVLLGEPPSLAQNLPHPEVNKAGSPQFIHTARLSQLRMEYAQLHRSLCIHHLTVGYSEPEITALPSAPW